MNSLPEQSRRPNVDDLVNFLLFPEGEHPDLECQLTAFACSELESLDPYLKAHAGDGWVEGKTLHNLTLREDSWRMMWPTRVAARLLLVERESGNPSWRDVLRISPKPLQQRSFEIPSDGLRNVVISAGFLDVELTRPYHPVIAGSRLSCEEPDPGRISELIDRYRAALTLLKKYDTKGHSVFANSTSAIVPLKVDPPLELGKCVSLAIASAPGVVLLTMVPIILLSETLLHESSHCRLNALESLTKLWVSGATRVASPLRPDPRPISGLYHQAYVLFWLTRFYGRLREAEQEPSVERNRRQVDKRREELTAGFRAAITTLRENRSELTPLGVRVVEEMASIGEVP